MKERPGTVSDADQPRRRWERHEYGKEITLELSGGRSFSGETRNVSLNGVFLLTGETGGRVQEGDKGRLYVPAPEGRSVFACQVARVAPEGLALEILEHAAAFGMLLTQDIFQQIQSSHPNAVGVRPKKTWKG